MTLHSSTRTLADPHSGWKTGTRTITNYNLRPPLDLTYREGETLVCGIEDWSSLDQKVLYGGQTGRTRSRLQTVDDI